MNTLSIMNNPFIMIAVLLSVFGAIAIFVFLARKHIPFLRDEDKPLSEEEAARETLKRFLVPVEEETKLEDLENDLKDEDAAKKEQEDEQELGE